MTDKSSDQKGRPGCTLRCAMPILTLLAVSLALCSEMAAAAGQVHPTIQSEVEKRATQHSTCYAVQVGAYKKRVEAVAMLVKLAQIYSYRMTLTQVGALDNVRWRLRVLATSRDEALKASERLLAEQGVRAWIVPMPCTNSVKERLDSAIPTPHTETPEPASHALMKKKAVPPAQVSATLNMESPALRKLISKADAVVEV